MNVAAIHEICFTYQAVQEVFPCAGLPGQSVTIVLDIQAGKCLSVNVGNVYMVAGYCTEHIKLVIRTAA